MFRFFEYINIDLISKNGGCFTLNDENTNHARNVLRLNAGDQIILCDGNKNDYIAHIIEIGKKTVIIKIDTTAPIKNEAEPPYRLTIFQALPKLDKMDLIIQKCVELGVYCIVPFISERVVVKLNEKSEHSKQERWAKIAEAAAKQSGRGIIPKIAVPVTFKDAVEYDAEINIAVAYEKETEQSLPLKKWLISCKNKNLGVFIGPEGGFSVQEIDKLTSKGAQCVTLGKRILRTETTSIAIAAYAGFEIE